MTQGGTVKDIPFTVNGSVYAAGPIPLNVGTNEFRIGVTAEDGVTTRSYSVTVNRSTLPAAPDQFMADPAKRQVMLSWKAEPGLLYNVYQEGVKLNTEPVGGGSYTITGLPNGKKITFSVTALNAFLDESAPASLTAHIRP
ncbi:cadherin-like beta sandwich domain-containing protein [Paenibacillus sp. P25]|nr:cadherin-like beta sandwich domain-containing protein [Paenibacillus sp. P25]